MEIKKDRIEVKVPGAIVRKGDNHVEFLMYSIAQKEFPDLFPINVMILDRAPWKEVTYERVGSGMNANDEATYTLTVWSL